MSLPLLTYVESRPYKFLIMDAPRDSNMPEYIREMKKRHVTDIVRVCEEKTYDPAQMVENGIAVHDMSYKDGTTPKQDILTKWLDLCQTKFHKENSTGAIAIHCVAGLGRAPLMVAIAIMEERRDYTYAVDLIRKKRNGCINRTQLEFLKKYVPITTNGACCVIC